MVAEWGMSDKLGRVRYNANEQEIFLGHSVAQQQNVSEATAELIDSEVRRLIEVGEGKARDILSTHIDQLHIISEALLEYETLSGEDVNALLRGEQLGEREKTMKAPAADAPKSSRRGSVPTVKSGEVV
jgi:cell division protease FtsH